MDPLLKAADVVTERGDAVFDGETDDLYLVHNKRLAPGELYTSGSITVRILRSATKEEYLERCPHLPKLAGIDRYFIHAAKVL